MKKLMILGGSRYAIPVIEAAHNLGLYVITCDYLPESIAHQYSDEYCNVSVIDKEKTLAIAKEKKIDGIVSFACNPGVVTAAYVAEKMGLPFQCSYESARILQDKGLFRQFLIDNGFNSPKMKSYSDLMEPFNDLDYFSWPVMVKPSDSAGSKGVVKVDSPENLSSAINIAIKESINGTFIIEDFLEFEGYHSDTDPFSVDGKLKFISFSEEICDKKAANPYVPAFDIWPSTMKAEYQNVLAQEIQRLFDLLKMKTGIYNIETCVANGKAYLMEVSPRGGGGKIAEIQKHAFGIDLIEAEVKKAVGMEVDSLESKGCDGFWCKMVIYLRSNESGIFKSLQINQEIMEKYVRLVELSVKEGDLVQPFTGSNNSLGDMFLRFDSREELDDVIGSYEDWLHINLQSIE